MSMPVILSESVLHRQKYQMMETDTDERASGFVAQHATATCCRGCLEKWHRIPKGRELTEAEQEYIVNVIMEWIGREIH